jgi:hypothetical protein
MYLEMTDAERKLASRIGEPFAKILRRAATSF